MGRTDRGRLVEALGRRVFGADGRTIGTVDDVYYDAATLDPLWAVVETGLYGAPPVLTPLSGATSRSTGIELPFARRHVLMAPTYEPPPPRDAQADLCRHYGVALPPDVRLLSLRTGRTETLR